MIDFLATSQQCRKLPLVVLAGLLTLATSGAADETRVLSAVDPSTAQSRMGNGDSVPGKITPDGRYVLFSSSASDLVVGGSCGHQL